MLEVSGANQRVLLHRARAAVRTRLASYLERGSMSDLTCQEFVELVTDYFEGALDRETTARFDEHRALCPGLRDLPAADAGDGDATGGDPGRVPLRGDAVDAALRLPRRTPLITARRHPDRAPCPTSSSPTCSRSRSSPCSHR